MDGRCQIAMAGMIRIRRNGTGTGFYSCSKNDFGLMSQSLGFLELKHDDASSTPKVSVIAIYLASPGSERKLIYLIAVTYPILIECKASIRNQRLTNFTINSVK